MKKTQRWLCLLLVLCLLLSVMPVTAMAAEAGAEPSEQAATVLYQEGFDTALPEGLDTASWERVELKGGGYALRGTSAARGALLTTLPTENNLPTEYTIVADMALMKKVGNEGYSAGVMFQHTDSTHFYHFRLDHGVKTSAQLLQWPDKKSANNLPAKQETTVTDGQAYRLRVTVSSDKIIGYVDSVKQFEYDASAAGGAVGLRVYNAVALFDNITVYSGVVAPETGERAVDLTLAATTPETKEPEIFVNQIGYDNGTSMRATIPNVADGTPFTVMNKATGEAAYTGTVMGGIADFTGQITTAADTMFYITCAGKQQSYDFEIGTNLIQRRSVKNALAFMNEVRSDVGTKGNNSIAWRDGHQFSFELNGLVLQYMANPSVYNNMPHTVFAKMKSCEYEDLKTQSEPDIIWLIKFAARRYYDWGCTQGKKLHMLTKEQLAYYLYLAPELIARGWETQDFYQKVRDYTISVWGKDEQPTDKETQWHWVDGTNHDLYSVQTVFGGLKGSQPMGHSIVPNLMMYEVAKRDGLRDETANAFLKAAIENCAYTIGKYTSNLDANGNVINDICDPFFCKGQRMSEYITIPALGYFIEMCPADIDFTTLGAEGLTNELTDMAALKNAVKDKIAQWATVNIARGNNLWDIRKAVSAAAGDLTNYQFHNPNFTADQKKITNEYWTGAAYAAADKQGSITGDSQSGYLAGGAPKNEPGNQAGLQAVMYAAARVLKDNAETTNRLHALGVAAIDDLFGRNPTGMAAFYHFTRDFEGADLGWYKQYRGGAGVLGGRTAVIDANAPEGCYPYNPEAYASGYTEGWVAYNTAWNASLAYSQAENVALAVDKQSGAVGDTVNVTLTAPIDMDTAKTETGTVWVTNETTGERMTVTVAEDGVSSTTFTGSFKLENAETVTVSYGSGLFRQEQTITVTDFHAVKATGLNLTADKTAGKTGERIQLTAVVTPDNATDKEVTYTSNNESVATVDGLGNVTLLAEGNATITVSLKSNPQITDSVELTVTEAEQSRYTFDLLQLLDAGNASGVATAITAQDALTGSYGKRRVKLTAAKQGDTATFELGSIQAGTYQVTLYSKYVNSSSQWGYGSWSFRMNDDPVGSAVDFGAVTDDIYKDCEIGTVTLCGGNTNFSFVSENGKPLVPVKLTLTPVTPPAPVIPVTPSEPAKLPFNPNAGSGADKLPFTDVSSNNWYYSSVRSAWEKGLIDGVTASEFRPDATLTVAQAIKLAAALHQLDRTGEVSLKNGGANWYDSYVNYAVTNGIIEQEYANYTKAQLNAPVTRGEFVHIFHGAEEAYKAINTVADNAIPDVKATDKFAPEIYEFYRAGILTGSDVKGTFHSASTIKRSEAAAILLRMFESAERKSITLK